MICYTNILEIADAQIVAKQNAKTELKNHFELSDI